MSAATRSLDLTPVSHIPPHAQATRAAMPRPGAPKQAGPAASTPPGQGGHDRGGAFGVVCMHGWDCRHTVLTQPHIDCTRNDNPGSPSSSAAAASAASMDGNGKSPQQQTAQQQQQQRQQQQRQQQEGASPSPLAFYQYILRQGELNN